MENLSVSTTNPLVEPLTPRELDILKLLAQNLSNREIATRLFLALSSVKWYAGQVYAKLGVENRRQAVQKAGELGLLPRPALSRPTHNLPRQITRLIGREKEIDRVVEMIWEYPLVTLTGPGGVGKTRLALAAGQELLDDFANGVWFVEIAPLSDPLLVERSLADVLGIHDEKEHALRNSLITYLQDRQALLIFDNCEHMLDACSGLANDLLKSLPRLKVLVSSRELLGVTGEAVFRVPSLSFPREDENTSLDQLLQYEAVNLFIERARAAQPDFQLNEQNIMHTAQICRRLDGIPLAIELAASRVSGLDVKQIATRLDQAFRLLSGGNRNALERHRTLRAAVDWSYNLLAEKERLLLRLLTVFVGGCTLEAAEAVCAAEPILPEEILDLLFQLSNKSMLVVEQSHTSEMRYRLLETIRQYAEDKQDDANEIDRLRHKHCDWFVQFAEIAEPRLGSRESPAWTSKLVADIGNLRAALEWSIAQNADPQAGMRILNALTRDFLSGYYYAAEARRWIEKGLAALADIPSVPPLLQARSLVSKAWLNYYVPPYIDFDLYDRIFELCQTLGEEGKQAQACALLVLGFGQAMYMGDLQQGLDRLIEGEALMRTLGDWGKWNLICLLVHTAWVRSQLGDLDGALACGKEGSAISHEMGSAWAGVDDVGLGDFYYKAGDYVTAENIFEKAVIAQLKLNDPRRVDLWLRKLGDAQRAQGKYVQANANFIEALRWTSDMANWSHVVSLQCCFAFTTLGQARELPTPPAAPLLLRTAHILGAVQPVMEETGGIFPIEYQAEYDRALSILRERLDPLDLEAAWTQGSAQTLKQAVAFLMNEVE